MSSSDPLLGAIRSFQQKNGPSDSLAALEALHKRMQKIAKHPFETKYRVVDANDPSFEKRIGRMTGSADLLKAAGFVGKGSQLELKANAEAWSRLMQTTALLGQAVREGQHRMRDVSGNTEKTSSTNSSPSIPDETLTKKESNHSQHYQGSDRGSQRSSSRRRDQDNESRKSGRSSKSQRAAQAPPASPIRNPNRQAPAVPPSPSIRSVRSDRSHSQRRPVMEPPSPGGRSDRSSRSFQQQAVSARVQGMSAPDLASQHSVQSSNRSHKSKSTQSTAASTLSSKFKAAAKQVTKQQQGPASAPIRPGPGVSAGTGPTGGTLISKFKAAAQQAAQNPGSVNQRPAPAPASAPTPSGVSMLSKFKAAAQQAAQNPDLARQGPSGVQGSMRNLNRAGSVRNFQNSQASLGQSPALSKFQGAVQQVARNPHAANPGQAPAMDPRAQFRAAAMAVQAGGGNTGPPVDPRSRFQQAVHLAKMQQRGPPLQQPMTAANRWNLATAATMRGGELHSQQMRGPPGQQPMSAAARWKMAANAAQATVRMQQPRQAPKRNSSFDGLSYPTASDSANDGLSYPTAMDSSASSLGYAGEGRGMRRSKSFEDGRPFMLRTDSGRSMRSNQPLPPQASSRNLRPGQSNRNMMSSQSMRNMNPSGPSMRNLNAGHQSMQGGMMMHQQSMRGGMDSRPQLTREASMSMRQLERNPGVAASRRHMNASASVRGDPYGSKGVVSSTPNEMPEQPKTGGGGCSCLYLTVNLVTAGELSLDLVTTILSFIALSEDFECCGNKVDFGKGLTMGVTIPYFVLIIIELGFLTFSICSEKKKQGESSKQKHLEGSADEWDDESTVTQTGWQCSFGEVLSWLVCANPFLGCLIAWALLYEVSNKNEALMILGIEGAAIGLMFFTVFLERDSLSTCTLMVHLVPLVPFTVTCFVVWYYLEKGGICFAADQGFWFDGCELCSDGWPPTELGGCPDGILPTQDTFCGATEQEQFCYFGY